MSEGQETKKGKFDFDEYVKTSSEKDLDAMSASRFSMRDPHYSEMSKGFPKVIVVYPWSLPTVFLKRQRPHSAGCSFDSGNRFRSSEERGQRFHDNRGRFHDERERDNRGFNYKRRKPDTFRNS
uniref:Btz domain-containing protein n=1 Tax=Syphacia muris TaxID=451379 RepID=A0A0N5AGL0_9BILA